MHPAQETDVFTLVSQMQACDVLIEQHQLLLPAAAELLDRAGTYLRECAQYSLSEPLYQQAVHIREQQEGPENLALLTPLLTAAPLNRVLARGDGVPHR